MSTSAPTITNKNLRWVVLEFAPSDPTGKLKLNEEYLSFLREFCGMEELPAIEFQHTDAPDTVCFLCSYLEKYPKEMIFNLAAIREGTEVFHGKLLLMDYLTDTSLHATFESMTFDMLTVSHTPTDKTEHVLDLIVAGCKAEGHALAVRTCLHLTDEQINSSRYAIMNSESTTREDRQWLLDLLCEQYEVSPDNITWYTVPFFTAVGDVPPKPSTDWVEHGQ